MGFSVVRKLLDMVCFYETNPQLYRPGEFDSTKALINIQLLSELEDLG